MARVPSSTFPRPQIIELQDDPRMHIYGREGVPDNWTQNDQLDTTARELTVHWEDGPAATQAGRELKYYVDRIAAVAFYHMHTRDWANEIPGVQHANGIQYHYYIADRFTFQVSPETLRTWNAIDANRYNIAVCVMAGRKDVINWASVSALHAFLDWMTHSRPDLPLVTALPGVVAYAGNTYKTYGVLGHDESLVRQGRPTQVKGCPGIYKDSVSAWRKTLAQPPRDALFVSPPTISPERFEAVLRRYNSPALDEAPARVYYDAIADAGINPALALAFFVHENEAGTNGGPCVERKNWGCVRTPEDPTLSMGADGGYARYSSWLLSLRDWIKRIKGPKYAGEGRRSVRTVLPKYAPRSDNNDPEDYGDRVMELVAEWREGNAQ